MNFPLDSDSPSYWDKQYDSTLSVWDLKTPSPVFKYALEKLPFITASKILILGSGKSFDAILAAEKGFDVSCVDFSQTANKYTEELASKFNVKINVYQKDFFALDESFSNSFDIVYEYVTFCAINPKRREELIKVISKLLKPNGRLITTLFPIDAREGGPPFSIDFEIFHKQAQKFFMFEYINKNIPSVRPRKGKEVLLVYRKFGNNL